MWKAIKWGFGIAIGIGIAYAAFWIVLLGGFALLVMGG